MRLRLLGIWTPALLAVWLTGGLPQAAAGHRHPFYPPLLDMFYPQVVGEPPTLSMTVTLSYGGGQVPTYPGLGAQDTIPVVRVRLVLPPGVRIRRGEIMLAPPNNGLHYPRVKGADLRWRLVGGQPTWVFHHLAMLPMAGWRFWLSASDPAQALCVTAVATFPGLAHAPTQRGTSCYEPGGAFTSTTSP